MNNKRFWAKFRPALTIQEERELKRLSGLNLSAYNESDIREEFIVPLLRILGYQKELDYSIDREETYNLHPLFLSIGRSKIKLDYITSVRKQYFWVIEAKSAKSESGNEIDIKNQEVEQAYFYSLHQEINCPYFLVTNGWYIKLFSRDELDKECTPLLTIEQSDLKDRFLELDKFIGATQLLPFLKDRLLEQTKKILSSEVHLERIDEYIYHLEMSLSAIKPKVLQNFKNNAKKQHELNDIKFVEALKKARPFDFTHTYFLGVTTQQYIQPVIQVLIERLKSDVKHGAQYMLFSGLLLEVPRPVNYWYYINVTYFLCSLAESDIQTLEGYNNIPTLEIALEWIELCLFHFDSRKDLKYLWLLEGVFNRFFKRVLIMNINLRDNIIKEVSFLKYFLDEENIALNSPHPASSLLQHISDLTLTNMNKYIVKNYNKKKRKFNENQALQELNLISSDVVKFESITQNDFIKIKEELGDKWSELTFMESQNKTFDNLNSGICEILLSFPKLRNSFSERLVGRIAYLANTGYVNYANELLNKFNVEVKYKEKNELQLDNFFTPERESKKDYFIVTYNPKNATE